MIQDAASIAFEIAKATENNILSQLDWFIKRGLLTVEYGETLITYHPESSRLQYCKQIELKLKDKEYIEGLEKQIDCLKETIQNMRKADV